MDERLDVRDLRPVTSRCFDRETPRDHPIERLKLSLCICDIQMEAVGAYMLISYNYLFSFHKQLRPFKISFFQGKQVDDAQELQEVKVENPVSGKENTQSGLMVSVKTAKEYVQYAFVNNEASNIDRVCRFLFPSCYLIFNIIYWCYYELSSSFGKRPDE